MTWNQHNVINKKICVGIVYLDGEGKITERVQNHGTIVYADAEIIEYQLSHSNQTFTVPAYYDNLENADRNLVYVLENSGEQVNDLDIVATYTVVPEENARENHLNEQ